MITDPESQISRYDDPADLCHTVWAERQAGCYVIRSVNVGYTVEEDVEKLAVSETKKQKLSFTNMEATLEQHCLTNNRQENNSFENNIVSLTIGKRTTAFRTTLSL